LASVALLKVVVLVELLLLCKSKKVDSWSLNKPNSR
jgi:hypothetical protein